MSHAQQLASHLPYLRRYARALTGSQHSGDAYVRSTLEAALDSARDAGEISVIGGGEIFAMTLPIATHMHLTWVDAAIAGADAFFPRFDPAQWRELSREAHAADTRNEYPFEFVDYVRREPA